MQLFGVFSSRHHAWTIAPVKMMMVDKGERERKKEKKITHCVGERNNYGEQNKTKKEATVGWEVNELWLYCISS